MGFEGAKGAAAFSGFGSESPQLSCAGSELTRVLSFGHAGRGLRERSGLCFATCETSEVLWLRCAVLGLFFFFFCYSSFTTCGVMM